MFSTTAIKTKIGVQYVNVVFVIMESQRFLEYMSDRSHNDWWEPEGF